MLGAAARACVPFQPALYRFRGLDGPVDLAGCADVLGTVAALTRGWEIAPWTGGAPGRRPVISVERRGARYALASDDIDGEEDYGSLARITVALLAELMTAYGLSHREILMLHAAAIEAKGRVIAFPARGGTGKSLLSVQLARHGLKLFSDDVLPLDIRTGEGRALGITPRVRLPLPRGLDPATAAWIGARTGLGEESFAYVGLDDGAWAALEESAPIGAFVQLVRGKDAEPGLSEASRADIMRLVIRQNFGGPLPARDMVEGCARLIGSVPCYRLAYRGGEEAAELMDDVIAAL